MKPANYIASIMALILLSGCATTFRPWRLSEIEEGMDRAHVVSILGEPDSSKVKNGSEFLYYSYSENYNPAPANDDFRASDINREFREQQLKRSLKEYNYAVKLVDGKVQNYKELTD